MAYFDRYDIAEAHCVLEWDYHVSGILQERVSNIRRNMSTGYQLSRMGFKPSPNLCYEELTENGKEIYHEFVELHNLPK